MPWNLNTHSNELQLYLWHHHCDCDCSCRCLLELQGLAGSKGLPPLRIILWVKVFITKSLHPESRPTIPAIPSPLSLSSGLGSNWPYPQHLCGQAATEPGHMTRAELLSTSFCLCASTRRRNFPSNTRSPDIDLIGSDPAPTMKAPTLSQAPPVVACGD